MKTYKLAQLTWPEIDHRNGIIIPVGTCEQHGRHLPLNTDILLAEYFAERLAEHTQLYIAPTINYGVNHQITTRIGEACLYAIKSHNQSKNRAVE